MQLYTIGHSNQPLDSFLAALTPNAVSLVVDVRRFPSSRRHPQFSGPRLAASLAAIGIDYRHAPELGGHREPAPDSPNVAWREDAFRGYADYMETEEFRRAIATLVDEAATRSLTIMCAERAWQHCHRGLIADYLKAQGHHVVHILDADTTEPHPYTRIARIVDGTVSYRGLL
jgi:uncharacterized protein (DUF488 family)